MKIITCACKPSVRYLINAKIPKSLGSSSIEILSSQPAYLIASCSRENALKMYFIRFRCAHLLNVYIASSINSFSY